MRNSNIRKAKSVSLTIILSVEDNNTLTNCAKEVGLKKSEYIRSIIQGIRAGTEIVKAIDTSKDVNLEMEGYGININPKVLEELILDVSNRLQNAITTTLLKPKKNLRYKSVNTLVEAS